MAGIKLSIIVEGIEEISRKLQPERMLKDPLRKLFSKAALLVEREAKIKAPIDTGRLRASITHEVSSVSIPLWSEIGTNVEYASFVEYGTSKWAGKPFMMPAFEKVKGKIDGLMAEARNLIEEHWRK